MEQRKFNEPIIITGEDKNQWHSKFFDIEKSDLPLCSALAIAFMVTVAAVIAYITILL